MHHTPMKSNLADSGSDISELGLAGNKQLLCPKPRRLGPPMPEFLKPLRCHKHSPPKTEGRSGILNMISDNIMEEKECICSGCSPKCYTGSPPGRTDNPLIHDVYFIHQMELLSPFTGTNLSDKFGISSASPF